MSAVVWMAVGALVVAVAVFAIVAGTTASTPASAPASAPAVSASTGAASAPASAPASTPASTPAVPAEPVVDAAAFLPASTTPSAPALTLTSRAVSGSRVPLLQQSAAGVAFFDVAVRAHTDGGDGRRALNSDAARDGLPLRLAQTGSSRVRLLPASGQRMLNFSASQKYYVASPRGTHMLHLLDADQLQWGPHTQVSRAAAPAFHLDAGRRRQSNVALAPEFGSHAPVALAAGVRRAQRAGEDGGLALAESSSPLLFDLAL